MGYVGCNTTAIMVILTLGLSISGLSMSGASMCPLDFAPGYSGIISAIVNVFAATSGFLVPLLIARFTEDQTDPRGWKIVFWISAGIMMFGMVFFLIFGTAELQPWARRTADDNKNEIGDKPQYKNRDISPRGLIGNVHIHTL
ncbi:sialin-like [Lytechinus pictus]|uniref:sialin-like n=1 Tax=Lytechinus pictus TaxID=7653 RepID=UPI0030B9D42C